MEPGDQAEVIAFLTRLAGTPPVQTHISAVFPGTDMVWKLKKAVRLGFLDFTALADREHFLRRELELNAPHAPGLYRDVVAVTRGPQGLALDGGGAVVDWVLRMAPVPPDDFLDARAAAGGIDDALLRAMADAVAAMHARQPPAAPGQDPVARMDAVMRGNAAAGLAAGLEPARVAAWADGMAAALRAGEPVLRARAGLVRRAHGDLHLGNLLLRDGEPVPFDALEFDEALATIDPGYDLAFLLMDLEQRMSRAAANAVLNRYVARTGDAGLVALVRPFLSMRAMIRAHVEAARGDGDASDALLRAAGCFLGGARPLVVAVGGLMGTGKSGLARAMAPSLGPAPGALVLRSDEIRKRLAGVAPEARLPPAAYTTKAATATEAAMLDAVRAAAAGGHAVVADATFLDPDARFRIAAAAQGAGVGFTGLWLEAPLAELERRVLARHGDASDATVAVLRAAHAGCRPPADWRRFEATGPEAALLDQVQSWLAVL